MTVPTISAVRPSRGAANGSTLIEIEGSGFKLPPDPPAEGPAPDPPPTVRVTIGGRYARHVMVYSPEYLVCLTPKGDPYDATIEATASAATNIFTAAGHVIKEGQLIRLKGTALPAPLRPATARDAVPLYAVNVVVGVSFKVALTPSGSAIDLTTNGAATVLCDGYQDVKVENLAADGTPIAGESATAERAYAFLRPDLARVGQIAWALKIFLQDMKRILANTVWTTHADYDPSTGDLLNLAAVSELPALVLADLKFAENTSRKDQKRPTRAVGTDRFVARRPAELIDLRFALTGASNNPIEALNLYEAVKQHFKKTPYLEVPRDPSDLNDVIRYDQHAQFADVAVALQQEGTTLHSFGMNIEILAVVSEVMPGAPEDVLAGLPADGHHEATTAFGYTFETPEVGVQPKSAES